MEIENQRSALDLGLGYAKTHLIFRVFLRIGAGRGRDVIRSAVRSRGAKGGPRTGFATVRLDNGSRKKENKTVLC